jgi:hypothetical protein
MGVIERLAESREDAAIAVFRVLAWLSASFGATFSSLRIGSLASHAAAGCLPLRSDAGAAFALVMKARARLAER